MVAAGRAKSIAWSRLGQGSSAQRSYSTRSAIRGIGPWRAARELERLRSCQAVVQYYHSETVQIHGGPVTCLISELVQGDVLTRFIARQPGRHLQTFEALHLLHALSSCLACIHDAREYHGDLHCDNVLVRRAGIKLELRILDFFHRGRGWRSAVRDDIVDAVRIFYDTLGGRRRYA